MSLKYLEDKGSISAFPHMLNYLRKYPNEIQVFADMKGLVKDPELELFIEKNPYERLPGMS